jgi:putative DNA primase/helicase
MADVVVAGQSHHNIAAPWFDAGMSVVPIQANGTKRPTRDWSVLQRARLTRNEVDWYWREGEPVGVAVICGAISGNLELLELEAGATDSESLGKIRFECEARGVLDLWDSLTLQGYAEWTPSGGLHLLYRIPEHEIPGNTKLASTPTGKTLAETRGEGGYVIVAPTNGSCHPTGEPWSTLAGVQGVVPEISWSQRMAIHNAVTAALDQSPPPPPPAPRREILIRNEDDLRPGDDFNQRASWDDDWFTGQGWTRSHSAGMEVFWVRPGKEARDGHSASTGYNNDADRLYVWSTSAGLPTEVPLTKFFVYAHYHHGGDMSRAARALRRQGYGASGTEPAKELSPWIDADTRDREVALPPVQGGFDLSDLGNGRRMKDLFGDRFRYNVKEKQWYFWTGTCWKLDQINEIHRAAEQCADMLYEQAAQRLTEARSGGDRDEIKQAEKELAAAQGNKNHGKLLAAVARFANQPGMQVAPEDFNADPRLLNLPNGTLDLESGELLPHSPEDFVTKTFGAELDKDAECPHFVQFMEDAVPDVSVREYVQRALGYSLLGQPKERAMFMLHGPSGTGKSVLTNLMTMMFGEYGATAPASTFRLKKQGGETIDLHRLRGCRFVGTSELPEGQQLDEDLVKRVTGGDMVSSRGHYQEYTEWKPQCVIWLATNFLPKVNSDDNAIWRRAKTIRMATEFGSDGRQEILGYADILYQEASGILNWLLQGLEAYKLRGLDEPSAVTSDIESYRVDVDSVASFIRDKLEEGSLVKETEAEIKSSVLNVMFDVYCNENRMSTLGRRRFANRMKAMGYSPMKVGGAAFWKGLRPDLEHGVLGSF